MTLRLPLSLGQSDHGSNDKKCVCKIGCLLLFAIWMIEHKNFNIDKW